MLSNILAALALIFYSTQFPEIKVKERFDKLVTLI